MTKRTMRKSGDDEKEIEIEKIEKEKEIEENVILVDPIKELYNWILGIFIFIVAAIIFFLYITYDEEGRRIEDNNKERVMILNQATNDVKIENELNDIDKGIIIELQSNIKARENNINRLNACKDINKALTNSVKQAIHCDDIPAMKLITPKELFYTIKVSDKPYITQGEEEDFKKANGGILATDLSTGYKSEIYAPDYLDKVRAYEIETGTDTLLGDYVKLKWEQDGHEFYWIIAHIRTKYTTGQTIYTGQRLGEMNLSGATTGYHSHIELWMDGVNVSYSTRSIVLLNKRAGVFSHDVKGTPIRFTSYDLGDVAQNDASPCVGASGKNLCNIASEGIQTVAITIDVRKQYSIKFGDIITLKSVASNKEYSVQVEDEMNSRFRYGCIRNGGEYCIKGDVARYKGEATLPSGNYLIIK